MRLATRLSTLAAAATADGCSSQLMLSAWHILNSLAVVQEVEAARTLRDCYLQPAEDQLGFAKRPRKWRRQRDLLSRWLFQHGHGVIEWGWQGLCEWHLDYHRLC